MMGWQGANDVMRYECTFGWRRLGLVKRDDWRIWMRLMPCGLQMSYYTMQVIDKEKISIIKDVQILGAYMWKQNPRYIASPSLICEELSPRLEPVVRRISPANLTTLPWTWNRQSRNVSLQSLSDFLDLPVPNTRSWNHLNEFNCHFWHRPSPCVKRILGLLNYST